MDPVPTRLVSSLHYEVRIAASERRAFSGHAQTLAEIYRGLTHDCLATAFAHTSLTIAPRTAATQAQCRFYITSRGIAEDAERNASAVKDRLFAWVRPGVEVQVSHSRTYVYVDARLRPGDYNFAQARP